MAGSVGAPPFFEPPVSSSSVSPSPSLSTDDARTVTTTSYGMVYGASAAWAARGLDIVNRRKKKNAGRIGMMRLVRLFRERPPPSWD
ncbi:MAG: hypothetical protein LBS91_02875 [Clostridiales Family XIII bacterium]|nr:hypothetical protein [Clostridiales Family XIII bacterium]